MKKIFILLTIFFMLFLCLFCEKEGEELPSVEFKTGTGYTYRDSVVTKGSTLKVGILAAKADENLKSYNVSVSYDGAHSTITVQNFSVPAAQTSSFDQDIVFSVRDQSGTEKYYFTVVDVDGNIKQKSLTFTVE